MKKSILNLGKALSRDEQKGVNGGFGRNECQNDCDCYYMYPSNPSYGYVCSIYGCVPGIYFEPPCG